MYPNRKQLYKDLEKMRSSRLLVYVTGDRRGLETEIHSEVIDFFVHHLDIIGVTPKISLLLYTRGGNTLAGWSIINLIRQFCDDLEVIVPSKCHSTGTLMCLGANRIVMTKQATLGPIDPSVNTPLNPHIEGAPLNARVPVSVEAIRGYLELAKDELSIKSDEDLTNVLLKLSDKVHPLVLGDVYRARSQIQMLGKKLIRNQLQDEEKIHAAISFLCSESGSHDYTIHRREARDSLGLSIEKPDDVLYALIKRIYDDIHDELELTQGYDPNALLGANQQNAYRLVRALIESEAGGSHGFVSEGILGRMVMNAPDGTQQVALQDQRTYEGWRLTQ
ncbi:SDH family Clp fold serine proteinase [Ectothiorhodospira shaposhnikovii]|uniref:SDH family Clp fold serine proteinase n=1 Tax=Ectothiorhodospira shaposhnikovii TaxID=1054 RepID=UPI001EE808E7|nr:hypothetical protein [Ectothiorhodospira shaposhnikovii]MCG5514476.1 hypothetical protein [Ectothiorhodospira shaposhnikovii]